MLLFQKYLHLWQICYCPLHIMCIHLCNHIINTASLICVKAWNRGRINHPLSCQRKQLRNAINTPRVYGCQQPQWVEALGLDSTQSFSPLSVTTLWSQLCHCTSAAGATLQGPARLPSPGALAALGVSQATQMGNATRQPQDLPHPTVNRSQMPLLPQHYQQHPSFTAVSRIRTHAPLSVRGSSHDYSIHVIQGTAQPQMLLLDVYTALSGALGWGATSTHLTQQQSSCSLEE